MTLHPMREMLGEDGNRASCPASGELTGDSALPRAVLIFILALFTGCAARKPPALPVIAECGAMPAPVADCVAALPPSASDADLVRCISESRKLWKLDAQALRIQFAACAGK